MYLLDTDVLIWILRGNDEIIRAISLLKDTSPLAISVISIAEIYKNIFPSELLVTEDFLHSHIILDVDQRMAKTAGLYWQEYAKKLQKLSLTDCLIAATATTNGATLCSLNTKHFPMRDLEVIDPRKISSHLIPTV